MISQSDLTESRKRLTIAIAWCLAWGEERDPQVPIDVLHGMRQSLYENGAVPEDVKGYVEQVQQLQAISENDFPDSLQEIETHYPQLWAQQTRIGLVYGGATKIKQYVFEAAKLPDIRGASALLDRINLVDLPAFFGKPPELMQMQQSASTGIRRLVSTDRWLENNNFQDLKDALIPELIIYSTGGNILAFCPTAFIHQLADAIEKRYTHETLTANSCAAGSAFKLLELRFGLLQDPIESTFWLDQYLANQDNPIIQSYYDQPDITEPKEKFRSRKNFNELVLKLANQFTQRRNGKDLSAPERPSRCYPPMFETHPYLRRDESDRRSAVSAAIRLPSEPHFSDVQARKRIVGQRTKRQQNQREQPSQGWYTTAAFGWQSGQTKMLWQSGLVFSWVSKFERFLRESENGDQYYQPYYKAEKNYQLRNAEHRTTEARSLREISNASQPQGFVAYIYADGNNMGGYIRRQIKTPEQYQLFSNHISLATEKAVYRALEEHLHPHKLTNLSDSDNEYRNGQWIHPFEIVTIGGDDVLLIVPADKALAIAKTIGEEFETQLQDNYTANATYVPKEIHRYQDDQDDKKPSGSDQCELSMSIGVLITAEDTPIYYAADLVSQLLKSAKKQAKELRNKGYYGGTIDFLTMKAVTMISSDIKDFRDQGLTKSREGYPTLKLYASPYTLYEVGGFLETVKALKETDFPRSQLYQIRSLLEQGKHTAILNYRYFRVRLDRQDQDLLQQHFERAWCAAETNNGNLAPWMCLEQKGNDKPATYETLWRELIDLYPFIEVERQKELNKPPKNDTQEVNL